jgi:hypothetical protein
MVLQPFVGPWPLLQFRNLFCRDGRTPWTSDQPVARPLPKHTTTQTQNKHTHTDIQSLELNSNTRFQRSRERRQFMSQTARRLIGSLSLLFTQSNIAYISHTREQKQVLGCCNSLGSMGTFTHAVELELGHESRNYNFTWKKKPKFYRRAV